MSQLAAAPGASPDQPPVVGAAPVLPTLPTPTPGMGRMARVLFGGTKGECVLQARPHPQRCSLTYQDSQTNLWEQGSKAEAVTAQSGVGEFWFCVTSDSDTSMKGFLALHPAGVQERKYSETI
jgi:hypothetical protein